MYMTPEEAAALKEAIATETKPLLERIEKLETAAQPQSAWSPSEELLMWLDNQIDDAKRQQIDGFRTSNIAGERAWARHCALYEVRQKFASTIPRPERNTP